MLLLIKLAAATLTVFLFSWLPLVGAYNYEAAVCIAALSLVFVPIVTPVRDRDSRFWLSRAVGTSLLYWLCANLATISVALLRGQMCAPLDGLVYQLLITLPSVLLATTVWGWCSRISRFRAVRVPVYIAFIALDLGFALFALYSWPPLVTFTQFLGYFAGSIYDEAIDVTRALVAYRIGTLLMVFCFAAAQVGAPSLKRLIAMPVAALAIAVGWHVGLSELGLIPPMGRAELAQTLWQSVSARDRAWTVHFMPSSKSRADMDREIDAIRREYTQDFAELEAFFHNRPTGPIDVWLYPSADEKARFLAARHTSFARVWKNEIHLVEDSPLSTTPKHELAHLFAAQFADSAFGLAGSTLFPAMGWVEGLAMAAEWPRNERLSLHEWSAAIFALAETASPDDPIRRSHDLSPVGLMYGFWSLPSDVAYTHAGSFVRWLIDKYGIEKVKRLSASSLGEAEEIIGVDIEEAFNAWKKDLRLIHFKERATRLAELRFTRQSIWSKRCARNAAAQEAEFYRCLKDRTCDLSRLSTLCGEEFSPASWGGPARALAEITSEQQTTFRDVERAWQYYFWRGAGEFAGGRRIINSLLRKLPETEWTPAAKATWNERFADMMLHAGFTQIAAIMYYALAMNTLPSASIRRLELKQRAALYAKTPVGNALVRWFNATSDEERTLIYEEYGWAPSIAWLEFINAIERRKSQRAQKALMSIIINAGTTDPAAKLPPSALHELFRLAPNFGRCL